MRSLKFKGILAILFAFVSVLGGASLRAQVVDLAKEPVQFSEIHDLWRFHTGDDSAWADPAFDDSQWQLLRSDLSWSEQGYRHYSGMAWYRFKLIVPKPSSGLGLYIPELSTSYQVFANGKLIGQLGEVPVHAEDYTGRGRQIIPLPDDLINKDGVVRIAIRVSHRDHGGYSPGGPVSAISVGNLSWLAEWKTLQLKEIFWAMSTQSTVMLDYLLCGFAGLGMFALRRDERAYMWFAAASFFAATLWGMAVYPAYYLSPWHGYHAMETIITVARFICFLLFLTSLLEARKGRVFWAAVASLAAIFLIAVPGLMGRLDWRLWAALDCLLTCGYMVCLLILILRAARRGNLDARLLFFPIVLWAAGISSDIVAAPLLITHHLRSAVYLTYRRLVSWPMPVAFPVLAEFLALLSVLAVLILRFGRVHSDEDGAATKLESVRMSREF